MGSTSGGESVLCISGVKVHFPPFKPFPGQIALMNKVLKAVQHNQNALLESPTGTGKTLALLCSTLSWQSHAFTTQQQNEEQAGSQSQTNTQPTPPLAKVKAKAKAKDKDEVDDEDDFVSPKAVQASKKDPEASGSRSFKMKPCPKIFFASRTQSQLLQVLGELKNCPGSLLSGMGVGSKKLKVTLLGSRQHYCVNGTVLRKKKTSVDEQCKKLLEDSERPKCVYYPTNQRLKSMVLKSEDLFDVSEIKELAREKKKGCPYFVSRDLIKTMNLEQYMEGAIVVIDEAHNLESASREAVSFEISTRNMNEALAQLVGVCRNGIERLHDAYQELHDFLQSIHEWCKRVVTLMQERTHEVWKGPEFLELLRSQCDLDAETIVGIRKSLAKAVRVEKNEARQSEDIEDSQVETGTELPLHAKMTVEKLLGCLHFLTLDDAKYSQLYRAVVKKQVDEQRDSYRFCIWALSGKVAAESLVQGTKLRSLVLSSGTLSPLGSFAAELGVSFKQALEAPHVVNIRTNLWAGVVGIGVNECLLESTYRHVNSTAYQDDIGHTLAAYLRNVPHGALVFFPSYALLAKCLQRWQRNGIKRKIVEAKPNLFVEGNNKRDGKRFDKMINDYQSKIDEGCTFLCVYRGKLSEGINLKDRYARAIFIIGIPYPPYQDLKISLKREFQDGHSPDSVQFSGNQWYSQQAWRALNQAVGRVIRHRLDYGAVIFLDHRFKQSSNTRNLPKWMRSSVTTFTSNESALKNLKAFYQRHETLSIAAHANNENQAVKTGKENAIFSQTQPSGPPRRLAKRKPATVAREQPESKTKFGFIDKYFTKTTKKAKTQEQASDKAQTSLDDLTSQVTQYQNPVLDDLASQTTQLQNPVPDAKLDDVMDIRCADKLAAKNILDAAVKAMRELKLNATRDHLDSLLFDQLIQDIAEVANKRGIS